MGHFIIVISGTGGHGVERHKEVGETINFNAEGDWTVDSIARQIAEPGEVVDDLLTGIRTSGSFNAVAAVESEDASESSETEI